MTSKPQDFYFKMFFELYGPIQGNLGKKLYRDTYNVWAIILEEQLSHDLHHKTQINIAEEVLTELGAYK